MLQTVQKDVKPGAASSALRLLEANVVAQPDFVGAVKAIQLKASTHDVLERSGALLQYVGE